MSTNSRPGRYWKEGPRERKWKWVPDNDVARRLAIKQGAMFLTWAALSEPYSGNGQPEPHRWGDLPLDFDSEDISVALQDLKSLCLVHLPEEYDLDPYEMRFYLSGGKGFHAVLPARLFNTQDGDPRLPLIYKKIAEEWKERLRLTTLDLSLYNMQKGKMFRIPNIRRANGQYKVPVTLEEVRDMPVEQLVELSKAPRKIEKPL